MPLEEIMLIIRVLFDGGVLLSIGHHSNSFVTLYLVIYCSGTNMSSIKIEAESAGIDYLDSTPIGGRPPTPYSIPFPN